MIGKQVEHSHYIFSNYVTQRRWASMWHQVDEVLGAGGGRVLEIGPGPGIFKAVMLRLGVEIETLDLDPELQPDHVASATAMPFDDSSFDTVCAFQMLEHLPFDQSLIAFSEMVRVARNRIIISLPDSKTGYRFMFSFPKVGEIRFSLPHPRSFFRARPHKWDGEHYWEISKAGYSIDEVIRAFNGAELGVRLLKSYRVWENRYHHFLIFEKTSAK